MCGPPGSGKSLLAARLPSILPPLSPVESLEVSQIHSLAGSLPEGGLVTRRPFQAPHHTASQVALVGGGHRAQPGEVSLAHRGILFLDELPEFNRGALEALRQPLETGDVAISRANWHVTYPARFQLIAAMNPCRCGHLSDPGEACSRAPICAEDYQSRLSGPLLDRFDLFVDVPAVLPSDLALPPPSDTSADVASRINAARTCARERLKALGSNAQTNAEADGPVLEQSVKLDGAGTELLVEAAARLKLSARAYHRVQRVARTIADLDLSDGVHRIHVAEALSYRHRRPGRENASLSGLSGAA